VSLRGKFVAYLVAIHMVFAVGAAAALRENRLWLLGIELFFVLSFLAGLWLLRSLFEPIRLIRAAVDFIKVHDFSTRLREVGQKEVDPLIRVYNQMTDTLRQERIHSEEQEHFLQRILDALPSGIVALDLDGRISMVNPSAAAMLNRTGEDLAGRTLVEIGSPLADRLAELREDETRLISSQGRRRMRCRALHFMDRGFARRFLIMDELTEELHRSERAAYEKLIRMMSHEVNNTAGAVGSLLQSCLTYAGQIDEADRDDFANALGVAISCTGRMNRFVHEFAEVVRLPAPRKRPTDLRPILEDVARLFREDCGVRRIRWDWDGIEELPSVEADPVQMEQVFINIVKNAVEAIGEDGAVGIRGGKDQGRPFLVIRDDGGGIPPEVREHLFTPFFTSKENGQGIGLTMTQEILLGHGFDFSLESDERGHTSFTILF
jgi:nitrogen fixation/metabolism regulation signal transduction histidine kinase